MRSATLAIRLTLLIAVGLMAGCAAIVDYRADEREARAEREFPPVGQFVDVGGGRQVHAVVAGSGPDLVLIHGANGNLRDMTYDMVERMSDRYRVIAFDRPGFGYTDRADPSYDSAFTTRAESPSEQAAMLRAAAIALGADRPIVMGHSYGGAVALAWALDFPGEVAGVVDVAGVSMPWPDGLGPLYTIPGSWVGGAVAPPVAAAFVTDDIIDSSIKGVFDPDPVPPGYFDHFGAALSLRRPTIRANARQVNTLRPHVVDMSERYGDLDLPVEIVHGDSDTIVPLEIHSEPLSRLIPGANLTVLPGVGHMAHHADPAAVADAIDRVAERAGLR